MSCKDCPDQPDENGVLSDPQVGKLPPKSKVDWIQFTGGSNEIHLAMMKYTLPPNYSRGKFLYDGSIQYTKGPDDWEPPSPIDGYERDEENPWFFRPLWKSCQLRMFGTEIKEGCQCIQVVAICNHPGVKPDEHGKVTHAVCEACSFREAIQVPLTPQRTQKPQPFRAQATERRQSAPEPQ